MDNSNIKDLLTRFYNGETSLEEERIIKTFFEENEIDDSFKNDKELSDAVGTLFNEITVPENLRNELTTSIDNFAKTPNKRRWFRLVSISTAAVIIAVLGVLAFLPEEMPQDVFSANVEMSEEEAIETFEESIALLSKGFEVSCSSARKADETLEKSINTVVKLVK